MGTSRCASLGRLLHAMAWSPDNLKSWCSCTRPVWTYSIWRVTINRSRTPPGPDTPYYDGDATLFSYGIRWSPDGTLIAFNRGATQVLVRPDGSTRSTRTGFLTGSWSPDGSSTLGSQPDPDTVVQQDVMTGDAQTQLASFRAALSSRTSLGRAEDSVCQVEWYLTGAEPSRA